MKKINGEICDIRDKIWISAVDATHGKVKECVWNFIASKIWPTTAGINAFERVYSITREK